MSSTGTAIQIQRVRPRGGILMSAVLAAALGVGFFAGRATESTPTTAPEDVSVIAPDIGTDGIPPALGGFAPHLPKHASPDGPTYQVPNPHLPKHATTGGPTYPVPNHHLPEYGNV